jgi:hypothetical protein
MSFNFLVAPTFEERAAFEGKQIIAVRVWWDEGAQVWRARTPDYSVEVESPVRGKNFDEPHTFELAEKLMREIAKQREWHLDFQSVEVVALGDAMLSDIISRDEYVVILEVAFEVRQ